MEISKKIENIKFPTIDEDRRQIEEVAAAASEES